MQKVKPIPEDWPIQPLKKQSDAEWPARCEYCGLSWDDALCSNWVAPPSSRCPFEKFHIYRNFGSVEICLGYVVDTDNKEMVKSAMDALYEDVMNAVKHNELKDCIVVTKDSTGNLSERQIPDFLLEDEGG